MLGFDDLKKFAEENPVFCGIIVCALLFFALKGKVAAVYGGHNAKSGDQRVKNNLIYRSGVIQAQGDVAYPTKNE